MPLAGRILKAMNPPARNRPSPKAGADREPAPVPQTPLPKKQVLFGETDRITPNQKQEYENHKHQ